MIKKQLAIFLFIAVFMVGSASMVLAIAPTAADKTISMNEDASYTFTEADFGFSDGSEGNSLVSVKITTSPTLGSLTLSSTPVSPGADIFVADLNAGNLKFTPVSNANGIPYSSFNFTVTDNGSSPNTSSPDNIITFNVNAVNDAPVLVAIANQVVSTVPTTLSIPTSASDVDGDTLTYSLTSSPAGMTINSTGVISWSIVSANEGVHTVVVSVTDGIASPVTQSFTVTVDNGDNQAPVLAAIGNKEVMATVALSVDMSASDADPLDSVSFSISSDLPAAATFVDNGDGTADLDWTPTTSDEGDYTVTITVTDVDGLTDFETFTIDVVDFREDEEIELERLENLFEDYEDDFDNFDRDFCREYRRDDTRDMNDIEDDVDNFLDDELDELQNDIDDLDDDIGDADLDEDLEDDLYRDLDNLQEDLDNLVDEVEDWLADSDEERCTSRITTSGSTAQTYQAPPASPTTTLAPPQENEPSVTVTSITPPQTSGVVVSTTEGNSFASWENMRVLVWLVAGTVIGLAAIVFLLALLSTSSRRRRY